VQAGQVLLQLRDVESIIGQLQQLRTLIPELQSKVAVSQLAVAEAESKLKAREKEKKEQCSQTMDSVLVVDKEVLQQQAHVVEQQRRLLEERVRALNAATSHTDTLASELIHYQRLFACVFPFSAFCFHLQSPFITTTGRPKRR
jgi:predicted RNase H-like nuclease